MEGICLLRAFRLDVNQACSLVGERFREMTTFGSSLSPSLSLLPKSAVLGGAAN